MVADAAKKYGGMCQAKLSSSRNSANRQIGGLRRPGIPRMNSGKQPFIILSRGVAAVS
jgi:hypothetical protein